MTTIKTLIVDDEPLALDVLDTHLSRIPNIKIIQRCSNAFEAQECLNEGGIDLMFLDIQMPKMTGIEFLKGLENPPRVIFTTAYSEHAVEGFELDAIDYLLKPVSFDRLQKAVNKASEQIAADRAKALEGEEHLDHIFVKADKKLIKIKYEDILYIEGLKDYVIIKMPTGRVITLQTMKSLEERLPSDNFMRIHRSYIVNLKKIDALNGGQVEVNKQQLPIGKNYKDVLLDVINKNRL